MMNYGNAIGAQTRGVRDQQHEGQPARVVIASRVYATNQLNLWNAITNAERIPRWFLPISGELKGGGRYQLDGNAGGLIMRCDQPQALNITWEYAGNVSWVTVRLEPADGGARLTLQHIMLKDVAGEEHWRQYGPGATGVGWDLAFFGMGLHIESGGQAIDRDDSNAWLASDEGKAFLQACANSWGDAHTAAGEKSDIAQAMAARTAAFYTGS